MIRMTERKKFKTAVKPTVELNYRYTFTQFTWDNVLNPNHINLYIQVLAFADETFGLGHFEFDWEADFFTNKKVLVLFLEDQESVTLLKLKYG